MEIKKQPMNKHTEYHLSFQRISLDGEIDNNCQSLDKEYNSYVICNLLNYSSIAVTNALINSINDSLNGDSGDGFWGEVAGCAVEFYADNTIELCDSGIRYPIADLKEILEEWKIFIGV